MHARVTTVRIRPGKLEETLEIGRNSIAPAAGEQRGFVGLYLLTDAETGVGISITLWETEEDLKAGDESGYYREQLDKLAGVLADRPESQVYEVSIRA